MQQKTQNKDTKKCLNEIKKLTEKASASFYRSETIEFNQFFLHLLGEIELFLQYHILSINGPNKKINHTEKDKLMAILTKILMLKEQKQDSLLLEEIEKSLLPLLVSWEYNAKINFTTEKRDSYEQNQKDLHNA